MEIEKSPPEIAKKLWKILKIVIHMMMRKKRKTMVEVMQMLLRRGKIAGTAIVKVVKLHHHDSYYSALTCRSSDDINTAFFSPRHYEFSCSNTPVFHSKRRNNHDRVEEVKIMTKVFDILNRYDTSPLPGFGGGSPPVVRVTDSPFPVREAEEKGGQVDEDAEEFIRKFYKDLKKQKRIAALDSPSPYHLWAR